MVFTHTFPIDWDLDYITNKAGIVTQYSTSKNEAESTQQLDYVGEQEQYDAMVAILESYPVDYARDVLKPRLLANVAAKRWAEQQATIFNGMSVPADHNTISTIAAKVVLMDKNPDGPQTVRWKVPGTNGNPDTWVTFDMAGLVALGATIDAHVQACFMREEELAQQINAATTVEELEAIDVQTGWAVDA